MKASMPSLSSPIEFSMPPVVSTVRQGGFRPALFGDGLRQDRTEAIQLDQARHFAEPNVPEATMMGFSNRRRPSCTARSGSVAFTAAICPKR